MTQEEADKIVQDALRRYAGERAEMNARFAEDLRMNEMARQMLFSAIADTFNAKGSSLPGRGFFLRDFLACATPAEALAAISAKVFTGGKGKASHGGHGGHGSHGASEANKAAEAAKAAAEKA